jgi:hypothetical protein
MARMAQNPLKRSGKHISKKSTPLRSCQKMLGLQDTKTFELRRGEMKKGDALEIWCKSGVHKRRCEGYYTKHPSFKKQIYMFNVF